MQIEATGKSVEIAIQNGLLECGMKREDVEVKVVEQGGLFKKAKVILTWGEVKDEPVEEVVETVVVDENQLNKKQKQKLKKKFNLKRKNELLKQQD